MSASPMSATSPHMSDVAASSDHGGRSPAPSLPQSSPHLGGSSPHLGGASPAHPHTPLEAGGARDASSPLSILQTPMGSQRSRASANSRRNDLGNRSQRSDRAGSQGDAMSDAGSQGMRADDPSQASQGGPRATIWGTDIDVIETQRAWEAFFDNFRKPDAEQDSAPFYYLYLEQLMEADEYALNLDCSHLNSYDSLLYKKLVAYPGEMLFICDGVVQELFQRLFPDADVNMKFMVRAFNLVQDNRLRDLDPMDIDKLVSVKGMVTRVTPVIPDMKTAFFECSVCNAPHQVEADKGYIAEPLACTNPSCQAKNSMRIMHNRSGFADKQIIRLQEAPEHIPEGETPHTQSMCTWDLLVDVAKPGDRVEVTGIFRATSVRTNPRHRTLRAIYKTYLDIVHIRKLENSSRLAADKCDDPTDRTSFAVPNAEDDHLESVEERKKVELRELARRPNLYNQLATALAPSVWELDDVKKGVLLQLFGATNKQLTAAQQGDAAASKKRGEINVLLVGDPGTSKSQLLKYVHKVAPRGIYTSGKGSSAVGLTAYVTRDPETNEFVLESGALVLSDRGVCCIDEFDKMSDSARSILHEAMEQQTVSIAKAGIICSLNSRTSVLASANPIDSKYDPKRSVVDNINLGPTLLSRFDLIYLILDKPDERTDRQLAQHLVSLYQLDRQPALPAINQATLMAYISMARNECAPKLTDAAARDLMNAYVDMRRLGASRRVITATPRQLESLIRLSEAHARMRLSDTVDPADVDEAVRLMKVATQSAATDPTTGTIDMDLITTGRSAASRTMAQQLAGLLAEKFRSMSKQTLPFAEIQKGIATDTGMDVSSTELREALQSLERDGYVRFTRANVVTIV